MPIYYVVWEIMQVTPLTFQYQIKQLVKVFSCDLEDVRFLYEKEVLPLLGGGRQVQGEIFYREPENMFKGIAIEKSVWDI